MKSRQEQLRLDYLDNIDDIESAADFFSENESSEWTNTINGMALAYRNMGNSPMKEALLKEMNDHLNEALVREYQDYM